MSNKIKAVHARQIIDCKCRPLVEVDVITEAGVLGRGSAPTGSSVGSHEAYVLRDHNPKEYDGLSVHRAVDNVNKVIAPQLIGVDVTNQRLIDDIMLSIDGTNNKSFLGSNAIYSTSIACYRAAANTKNVPLYEYIAEKSIDAVPVPSFNVINGGKYKEYTQPFNEFIIVPYGADSIYEAVEIGVKVFQELKPVLTDYLGHEPTTASSYGYKAPSEDPEVVLTLINKAIENSGYQGKVALALDCASVEMYDMETNTYLLKGERVSSTDLIQYAKELTEKFDILFIEDLLDEDDWSGYVKAKEEITRTNIIGDDLIVTNIDRLMKACELNAIDGFVFKPNQIGTITEAVDTYNYAKNMGLIVLPSGRSGGVIDDVVMDFATGLDIGFIKNGAPRSGERISKLNFLMRVCDSSTDCKLQDISAHIKF